MIVSTPIRDFVEDYVRKAPLRLHMPGHKGASLLGFEAYDITEVAGADSLYEADGIIRESEANASRLFGCPTYYSTEGSSQCIRAMLYLVAMHARAGGQTRPLILAGRNTHKTFLSAVALLDLDVEWLYPENGGGYLSCPISPEGLEREIVRLSRAGTRPAAVYLTSPDYLGNVADIRALSAVCREHGVLLLVDNAHGAYLRFLSPSQHPMDLGADLCCDSAHKTLPVLTGGAYLHIGAHVPALFWEQAKQALSLFGSTSPSYLILQSLDMANAVMADEGFTPALQAAARRVEACRDALEAHGWSVRHGDEMPDEPLTEPLKLTVCPRSYGYTGAEVADYLRGHGIECEFSDPDQMVFMITPAITENDLAKVTDALLALPRREAAMPAPPRTVRPKRVMTVREALLSPAEACPVRDCVGRVLAAATVGCPPAVPIVACGEVIDEGCIACFDYYGIETCMVVR